MASIQYETEEWRAKGLPVDELLQSKPFLDDAQRHVRARRLGKAIASLDQCIEFVLNVDEEMTRWAMDFEQLWDVARKLFSSMAYSSAGASLMDAAEIFERCQQCYGSYQRHPTQTSDGGDASTGRSAASANRRQNRPSSGTLTLTPEVAPSPERQAPSVSSCPPQRLLGQRQATTTQTRRGD